MAAIVPLRKLDENCVMTITVQVTREFRFRIWCALRLIRLGWWIAGARVEVKQEVDG